MPSCSKIRQTRNSPAEKFDPLRLFRILHEHYGPSGWWPGESPLEVAVGAVLTQNTAWVNVEKAISNLKAARTLDLEKLHSVKIDVLAEMIRPSGYYNVKAKRLKNLIRMIMDFSPGDMDAFLSQDLPVLRETLLQVNGIGRETADSICCYAAEKTVFVVDAYTRRLLTRHGHIDEGTDYDEVRLLFEQGLPKDLSIYKDLHAYVVFIGKDFCRPKNPSCGTCPLKGFPRQVADYSL